MENVFKIIVQLAITSRVIAINFENILKALPTDIPLDFRTIMLEMYSKHPEDFDMPDLDDITLMDLKSMSSHVNKKDSAISTNGTEASMTKSVTKPNKQQNVTPKNIIRRSGNTNAIPKSGTPLPDKVTTTEKPKEEKTYTTPPLQQIPAPQMPIPIAIPIYPMTIMMPMRTYFEPVIHDHPPLYKIKEMIEADENKYNKKKKGRDCEISVEISGAYFDDSDKSKDTDTDTDTDNSSEYIDVGSEYYDGVIRLKNGRERYD